MLKCFAIGGRGLASNYWGLLDTPKERPTIIANLLDFRTIVLKSKRFKGAIGLMYKKDPAVVGQDLLSSAFPRLFSDLIIFASGVSLNFVLFGS